jgi:hypothetical protein
MALVFGREEFGLSDDELAACDLACSIPIGRLQVGSPEHFRCWLAAVSQHTISGQAGEPAAPGWRSCQLTKASMVLVHNVQVKLVVANNIDAQAAVGYATGSSAGCCYATLTNKAPYALSCCRSH